MRISFFTVVASCSIGLLLLAGCGEGGSGTSGLDCGDHGSEHEGHCHCDSGYLFDGTTCADPADITAICEEHTGDEEHDHAACQCPATGECHCEGTIVDFGGTEYCEPELHSE